MKQVKKTFAFFGVLLFALTVLSRCSGKKDSVSTNPPGGGTDCSTIQAKFAANVYPIIQQSCQLSGCHNNTDRAGGHAWTSYAEISASASLINSDVQSGKMPKTGSLTAAQKSIINCWVNSGALNN
ncbi:hypothetical protein [Niabella soli]|uniref:Cytochrome C Planctomycete-type domain-containing protein n=1 Tax=Niabella soli DSM 19437 TaxID=929713 RepID=W0F7J7_9BACT|nr:hypothetical protein [Niabella soli]AHF17778.1 hypothetical protein NIASO_14040 [Niabella soli DSM 19437]